ncbi:hypothetical protein P7C70_g9607, partial [Phenoliferia sp. Uapishka_3]
EAMASEVADKIQAAEVKEIQTLRDMQVFELVYFPAGSNAPLHAHFVYAQKKDDHGETIIDDDGRVGGWKARFVGNGNEQKEGTYESSYAATASFESFRLICGEATKPGFELMSADVKGAYLLAGLPYDVHLQIPITTDPELEAARLSGKVMLLKKCLYGLVESGYFWSKKFRGHLVELGFKCIDADRGVYCLRRGVHVLYVPTHVDDLFGATNHRPLWDFMIDGLGKHMQFSKNGPAEYHLGMLIKQLKDSGDIFILMPGFGRDMLVRAGMEDCSPSQTPMLEGTSLETGGEEMVSFTMQEYQELVGMLQWYLNAHPDMLVAVRNLGRHSHDPREPHAKALKHALRYVQATLNWGIHFFNDGQGIKLF